MIKFDFTSHFIIVLCLMVILVSTLIINNKLFRKFRMGYGAFYVICPSQYVTPLGPLGYYCCKTFEQIGKR